MNAAEREVIAEEEGGTSRFSTFVSILIALVSVVGAILAWRVAVASSDASSADTQGLLAEVDQADVALQTSITVLGHKAVYLSFVVNRTLSAKLAALGPDYRAYSRAFDWAASYGLYYVPANYLDRNENLDFERDAGETASNFALRRDTNPSPHYSAADRARDKARWLLGDLIWFGGALLALTLADAIRHPLRYFFLFAGIGILLTGSLAEVLIERLS